ncbi:MAG: hypothetical protein HOH43_01065 [Candidatus Latescibacteria bacterium]|jgi:hypothetical protein|nr:hypothetical protein [Candidatus Latescibacterota bacterium]
MTSYTIPYRVDLVGLAHTPQFYSDYHRFLTEWCGCEPEFDRFDDRHIAPAQAFFDNINNVETMEHLDEN